jgi:fermentation-respiration switch protein FrsA (DUF1100 family)
MLTLLSALVAAYLAVCCYMYFNQSRLMFLPHRDLEFTPTDAGLRYEDVELKTEDGVALHAWFVPAPPERAQRAPEPLVMLFCHGNAGNISHRLETLRLFHELGLASLLFDYRGYGKSQGTASEEGTAADARAAWEHLVRERGVGPERIVLFGRSLGGAVAARLAVERSPAALIVESSFTSAPDIGARSYPFLPVRLLCRLRFSTLDGVAGARCPVLVAHSREDEIVPYDMGRKLFAAAKAPKSFLELVGDHNRGYLLTGARYAQGLAAFLDERVGR